MVDLLDSKLMSAGRVASDDAEVGDAVRAVVADRARRSTSRRRRILVPALSIGAALALLGTGAAAASQWGPWSYVTDPDIVVARQWEDVNGMGLGSCESHLATNSLSPEARAAARDYLASLDIDSLQPDTEMVANLLTAVGRPDDLGRLIAGANVDDYDVGHTGALWTQSWWTDARILQLGLTQVVFTNLSDELGDRWPELQYSVTADIETQCSTDQTTPGIQ